MESMYVQFVKKLSMLGAVTMKTLQALHISFVTTAFQINPLALTVMSIKLFSCNFNGQLTAEDMRINDMITQGDFSWVVLIFLVTSPWLLYVYEKTIGTRWENLFFDISGERVNTDFILIQALITRGLPVIVWWDN